MEFPLCRLLILAADSAGDAPEGPAPGALFTHFIVLMIIMMVIMYLFVWRPQMKRQKERETKRRDMLERVSKGDEIVTQGGIHGTVHQVKKDKDQLVIQVDTNTKLTISRQALHHIAGYEDESAEEAKR